MTSAITLCGFDQIFIQTSSSLTITLMSHASDHYKLCSDQGLKSGSSVEQALPLNHRATNDEQISKSHET